MTTARMVNRIEAGRSANLAEARIGPVRAVGSADLAARCRPESLVHRDNHFSSSVAFFQIPDRIRDLTQREGPVDDWSDLAGLHKVAQDIEVLLVQVRQKHVELLAHEGRKQERFDRARHGPDPAAFVRSAAADQDADTLGFQGALESEQRLGADVVENEVITRPALGEIFLCVINHLVGAERQNQWHILRAANAGNIRP